MQNIRGRMCEVSSGIVLHKHIYEITDKLISFDILCFAEDDVKLNLQTKIMMNVKNNIKDNLEYAKYKK
jgi:hypothetical protein